MGGIRVATPLTTDESSTVGPYELLRPLDRNGLFLGRSPDGERVAVTVVPADVAVDPGFRADVAAARLRSAGRSRD